MGANALGGPQGHMKAKNTSIDWVQVRQRLAQSQAAIEKTFVEDDQQTRETWRRRAVELAQRRKAAVQAPEGLRTLVFTLSTERYGLELESLVEVLPFSKCTPVPSGPPELLGVFNRRGQIYSVLSLARILELRESQPGQAPGGYIIVLRTSRGELGLQVDQVERVAYVVRESLQAPEHEAAALGKRYSSGVTPDGIILLDVHNLVTHPVFEGARSGSCDRRPAILGSAMSRAIENQ